MSQGPHKPFFSPLPFTGRDTEMAQLQGAVGKRHCFYVCAEGGVGKTRLLREFHDSIKTRDDLLETGLIDLQQGRYLQPLLVMQTIVRRLRKSLQRLQVDAQGVFAAYDAEVKQFMTNSAERTFTTDVERDQIEAIFLKDLHDLAARYPIVIWLDTFEKLHPAIPEVQEFNFRVDRRFEDWTARLLRKLPKRVLVVLAGRPRPAQMRLLKKQLKGRLTTMVMQPFSESETTECILHFDSTLGELAPTIYQCSAGRPVVVALALAMARVATARGERWAPPAGIEQAYPRNQEILSEAFIGSVVKDLADNDPIQFDLLTKAVFLRQGLDIDLLYRLDPHSDRVALEREVAAFCEFPFVKLIDNRRDIWLFSLHDEMYELLLGKVSSIQRNSWYRTTIAYLTQRIQQLDPAAGIDRLQDFHALQSDLLFYKMALDPVSGYQDYRELFETVIRTRDADRDDQLQNDLARFYDPNTRWGAMYRRRLQNSSLSWEEIICEEAIRWMQRRILTELPNQNRYSETLRYANRIEELFAPILTNRRLLRAQFAVVRLEAQVYTGTTQEDSIAVNIKLNQTISELEDLLHQQEEGWEDQPHVRHEHIRLVLAKAYHRRGYHHRLQQRYNSAIADNRIAAHIFKSLGIESDGLRTQTLINLSFVLGEQGSHEEAKLYAERALQLAERQGARHLVPTALNTLARIERLHNPYRAFKYAQQARMLFEQQDSVHGLALCAIAEGLVRSQLASMFGFETDAGQEHYNVGCRRFLEACETFDTHFPSETSRRLEARIGLGCLHREYGLALRRDEGRRSALFAQARTVLREARDLATTATPGPVMASLLEDFVVMDEVEGRYDQALEALQQARSYIPPIYTVKQGVGINETAETRQVQVYWLRLAQIELQAALCQLGSGLYLQGCLALQRAFAFLHVFSRDARPHTMFRQLGRRALVRAARPRLDALKEWREETNFYAVTHRIEREPRAEMERIFRATEDELGFLS